MRDSMHRHSPIRALTVCVIDQQPLIDTLDVIV